MTGEAAREPTAGGVRFLGRRRDYWRLLTRGAALLMVTLGTDRLAGPRPDGAFLSAANWAALRNICAR